jgi:hypothetical protein
MWRCAVIEVAELEFMYMEIVHLGKWDRLPINIRNPSVSFGGNRTVTEDDLDII